MVEEGVAIEVAGVGVCERDRGPLELGLEFVWWLLDVPPTSGGARRLECLGGGEVSLSCDDTTLWELLVGATDGASPGEGVACTERGVWLSLLITAAFDVEWEEVVLGLVLYVA